jgi:hypothetical protein
METSCTTTLTMDATNNAEENTTRQSSKLSLGSSPSVLSADEQLDGDGPLTPTDKMQDDVEDEDMDEAEHDNEEDDDDDLSAFNSILQAGSPGSLSDEEEDMHTEQDSASPLSSVPDDFPLSRSASPELPMVEELTQEEEDEDEVSKSHDKPTNPKKRRKDSKRSTKRSSPTDQPNKKAKTIEEKPTVEESNKNSSSSEEGTQNKKRRRVSRSSLDTTTTTTTTEAAPSVVGSIRSRKRLSRQEDKTSIVKKEETEVEDAKTENESNVNKEDAVIENNIESHPSAVQDDVGEEEDETSSPEKQPENPVVEKDANEMTVEESEEQNNNQETPGIFKLH